MTEQLRFYLWSEERREALTNEVDELIIWPERIAAADTAAQYPQLRFRVAETIRRGVDAPSDLYEGTWPFTVGL